MTSARLAELDDESRRGISGRKGTTSPALWHAAGDDDPAAAVGTIEGLEVTRARPQRPLAPALAALAAGAVVVAASAPFALCSPPPVGVVRTRCPAGYVTMPKRAERIRRLLRSTERGHRLAGGRAGALTLCFKPSAESGTMGALVVLDERVGDRENAARLGHLLLHGTQAAMIRAWAAPARDCGVRLEELLTAEAQAHALEIELRRELGVTEPQDPFAFEGAFWSAPAAERIELVRSFLLAHPNGAPGVPGLVGAYRHRCAGSERPSARTEPGDEASLGPRQPSQSSGPTEQTP